jgi:hypothetical protein
MFVFRVGQCDRTYGTLFELTLSTLLSLDSKAMNKLPTGNPLIIHIWKSCLFKFGIYSVFFYVKHHEETQRKNV